MALGGASPSETLGVRCSAFRPGVGNYDENLKSAQTNVSFATPFAALNDPCETSLPVDSFQRSFLASSPERPTTPQISHDPSRQEIAATLVWGDIVRISPFYGRGISLIPTPPNSSRSHAPRGTVKPPQDASNAAAFENLRRIQRAERKIAPLVSSGEMDQPCAVSTTVRNASGSRTARSANILRLMRISACLRSWIRRL